MTEVDDSGGRPSPIERLLTATERLAEVGSWATDLTTRETIWSDGMYRIVGLEPDRAHRGPDAVLQFVHPEDRPTIAARLTSALEQPAELAPRTTEFRVIRADGSVRDVRSRGLIEFDARGRPRRWIGSVQDISDQRVSERELQAHYAVSQALRDWQTFEEGVVDLLRRLGAALLYPMGALWLWDEDVGALTCRAFWSAPDVDPGSFAGTVRTVRFAPGVGKPGIAWETQRPAMTPDIPADPSFWPRDTAVREGVRSAMSFPAVGPDGPLAVLTFYSYERRDLSCSLVRTLTGIGRELGRFLSRRRAHLCPRSLSWREIEVVRLAAEGRNGPAIARELGVAPSTVKSHFENIYERLGVSDRAAAVAHALRMGLID